MMQEQQTVQANSPESTPEATPAVETEVETGAETTGEEALETVLSDAELIAQLREELAAAQAKAADYLDKWQRAAAEFQNSRRRLEAQVNEEVERANAGLIMRLLPVLDDLDLAFQNVPGEVANGDGGAEAAWLQGFRQIRKKLLDTLTDYGVSKVAAEGEFDPSRHEAISSEPHETVNSGHIIAEVRAGYEFRGRVLRPALVRVAQ
jgi:molecular chaperone GrpE